MIGLCAVKRFGCWRKGISLVELVVVVAIVGLLASLLFFALNSARMSSRAATCGNNLRQFAIAALNYESSKKHLPPGTMGSGRMESYSVYFNDESSPYFRKKVAHTSFQGILLPFMEQAAISDQMDPGFFQKFSQSPNREIIWFPEAAGCVNASQNAPSFTFCPADLMVNQVNELIVFGTHPVWHQEDDRFAAEYPSMLPESLWPMSRHQGTNYLGCVGVETGFTQGRLSQGFRGSMSAGPARRLAEVRDGTSATYLVGETLGFFWESRRVRHSWLIGGLARARGDVPWGEAPNAFVNIPSLYLGDAVYSPIVGFGSMHQGFVNFAMVDGSINPVSRDVDWQVHFRSAGIADAGSEIWH